MKKQCKIRVKISKGRVNPITQKKTREKAEWKCY